MAYVVMERATGRLGTSVLQLGPADSLLVARTLAGVASALALAHARGIVHGDVSPANVSIDDERVWLLDFGMVGSREGGTPDYMAPERFDGRGEAPSDVYSLALLCWALLEGQPPPSPGVRADETPPRVVYGPPWLADLIDAMLHPDPLVRPSAQEVLEECVARDVPGPPLDPLAIRRRARALFVERPIHTRLRRWLAQRDLLAVQGDPGLGVGHVGRWVIDELLAAGARVVELVPGGGPLEPLQRLASDPRLPGAPFTIDPRAASGVVYDTADRLLARAQGALTIVVRGDGLSEPCAEVLRELARSSQISLLWTGRTAPSWIPERVALAPWSASELRELAAQLLGVDTPPDELEPFLERAQGVPRAVVEPLVQAISRGALARPGVTWRVDIEALEASWRNAGAGRVFALPPLARELGAAAAAWGRELPVQTALRWTGNEGVAVSRWKGALQELVALGLVRVDGSTLLVLGDGTRQRLLEHDQAGLLKVLAYTQGDAEAVDALHWLQLAVGARVSAMLRRRAPSLLQAVVQDSPELALHWVEAAWETCAEVDRSPALAVERVRARVATGRRDEAESLVGALPLAARPLGCAAVVLGHLVARDVEGAERVLGACEVASAPVRLAQVEVLGARGRLADAAAALAHVDPAELDDVLAARHTLLHAKLLRLGGDADRALAVLKKATRRDGRWHNELASAFLAAGMSREAAGHFASAAGMPGWSVVDRANLTNQAGVAWFAAGDLVPSMEAFLSAAAVFERLGMKGATARCHGNIAEAARLLGRFGVARRSGRRALELSDAAGEPALQAGVLSNLVELDLDEGLFEQGQAHLASAKAIIARHSRLVDVELLYRELRLRFGQGDAGLLLEIRRATRTAAADERPDVASKLMLLECRVLHRDDELDVVTALDHLEKALDPLLAMGRGADLADVRVGFAELLLAVGEAHEAERLATQARTWAQEFQRRPLCSRADRVLARVQDVTLRVQDSGAQLGRLVQLSVQLLRVRDPQGVFDAIAASARELTGADRAFVVRVHNGDPVPSFGSTAPSGVEDPTDDLTDETTGESLPRPMIVASAGAMPEDRPSWTVIRRCVVAGREVLVRDLSERDDLNRARSVRRMRLQAALAVPIDLGEELYGAVYVDKLGGSFDGIRGTIRLLRALARFAGVALDNAFFVQQQRRHGELAEEVLHDVRNLVQPFRDMGDGVRGLTVEDLQAPAAAVAQIALRYGDDAHADRGHRVFDLARVLAVWQRAYVHLASERQVRLHLTVDAHDGPLLVRGDPTELQRAIGNLLSNGIKYAQRGGEVRVQVGARALGAHPDETHPVLVLVIDVVDDGPGVPRGYEDRVFERDVQAVGARKGLGLGLTIARRVARDHGGEVSLLPSAGGHFRMILPLADGEDGDDVRGGR